MKYYLKILMIVIFCSMFIISLPAQACWQSAGWDMDIDLTDTATNRLLLPLNDDPVTPTLSFGDGDTGFYQSSDGKIDVSINTSRDFSWAGDIYFATNATAGAMLNTATSSTNPTIIPRRTDPDTGLGSAAVDQISLIAGGVEGVRIAEDGSIAALYFPEITTPTAIANFGAYYTKNDNFPYFQDGAGAEHVLSEADTDYGEMYLNANANVTTIETANIPIALKEYTTGSLNTWTFDAGSTAAITVYADYSGTVAGTVLATSTHGLTTGDIISIRGTTNYNGVFQITVTDGTHFYFTDTWVADDGASDFDEPSHLIAGIGAAGVYKVSWHLSSAEGGGAGSSFIWKIYLNDTAQPKSISSRKFSNNDVGAMSGGEIMTIADGDWVFLTAESSGTNTITNSYGTVIIMRL